MAATLLLSDDECERIVAPPILREMVMNTEIKPDLSNIPGLSKLFTADKKIRYNPNNEMFEYRPASYMEGGWCGYDCTDGIPTETDWIPLATKEEFCKIYEVKYNKLVHMTNVLDAKYVVTENGSIRYAKTSEGYISFHNFKEVQKDTHDNT